MAIAASSSGAGAGASPGGGGGGTSVTHEDPQPDPGGMRRIDHSIEEFMFIQMHIFKDEDGHVGKAYTRDEAWKALKQAQRLDVEYVVDRAGKAPLGKVSIGRKVKRSKD